MASWHLRLGRNPGPQKETIEKVFQSSIFTGKNKLAGFVSGRVFSSFSEKNMMRCQTPTSHAGLVRSLTCSIQDSISVFFRKLTPIRKTYQKKATFQSLDGKRKKAPKKDSLFQPGFKSSDLLVLYWYIWMCAPMKFRMEPDCVMIFVSLWRLEMDCSNNLGLLNSVVGTSTEPYKTCHLWSFLVHFIQGLLYLPSICLWVKKSHLLWLKMIGFLHLFLDYSETFIVF